MLERYPRNPFRPNTAVVDHISYCMSKEKEDQYFKFIQSNINRTTGEFRKPHLTVAYSYNAINDFPKIDFESSIEYLISPPVTDIRAYRYSIYTDPFSINHLVLYVHSETLQEKFKHYISNGATWLHETYEPFMIIESHTDHNTSTIMTLPPFTYPLLFDVIRFSRFGECLDWKPKVLSDVDEPISGGTM